ncbi:MAG: cytochrome c3 family protein [Myxococcota bacterium]
MAAIFPPWTRHLRLILAIGIPLKLTVLVLAAWYWFSPKFTDVGYAPEQPVAYSHKLHAGDLGIDCRYCHDTVEEAAWAALPPTATCMNCHKAVLKDSPKLARVRESYATGSPIPWVRIHKIPDYARFDHSVHVTAGVGCASCHGRIDQMKVVYQAEPLSMGWCLDCHRNPTPNLRPLGEVTHMSWQRPTTVAPAESLGPRAVLPPVHCSGCHQ